MNRNFVVNEPEAEGHCTFRGVEKALEASTNLFKAVIQGQVMPEWGERTRISYLRASSVLYSVDSKMPAHECLRVHSNPAFWKLAFFFSFSLQQDHSMPLFSFLKT